MKQRCKWCLGDPLYIKYHDEVWGTPIHDDTMLFEFLILEGAQAGLNWLTILKKQENYKKAFDNFDIRKIAEYGEADKARLLADDGIVRNRLKIESTIKNARASIEIEKEFGSLDAFVWHYVDGKPIQNSWKDLSDIPTKSEISDSMSKELKKRGFKFVGSTICYAFMQAVGMVNDHTTDCFRYCGNGEPKPKDDGIEEKDDLLPTASLLKQKTAKRKVKYEVKKKTGKRSKVQGGGQPKKAKL